MTAHATMGLLIAALCAIGLSLGSLLEHRGAQTAPAITVRHPVRSATRLLRSKWFAAGVIVTNGAGLLHIVALALAPISIVQAVLAGGAVLVAVFAERIFGWVVPRRQWWGVLLSAVGLVLLVLTVPRLNVGPTHFSVWALIGFESGLAFVGAGMLVIPRLGRLRARRAELLGVAGGLLFGVADIAVKALTTGSGLSGVLTSPWLAVALAAGAAAQFVSVRGLQLGDAVPVIALTGLAVNVANITAGLVVFGDPSPGALAGRLSQGAGFVLICVAALLTPGRIAAGAGAGAGPQAAT